jgi:membrane associated rhomboid family serine protease
VRWSPVVVYPVALLAASLAVAAQGDQQRATTLLWASTNLDNLADHPVRALVASAFVTDGDAAAWTALAVVGLAGVVVAAGPWWAIAVAVAAHLVGTAVGEGALAVRIARGLAPASDRGILDVGPSFVVVGVLVTTVVAGTRWWWRVLALAGFVVLVPSLFDGLLDGDVAALGHVTAVVVGLVAGGLVLRRRRRAAAEHGLTVGEPQG